MQDIKNIIIFNVGDMICGIDLTYLLEITKNFNIISVPLAPPYVKGVMNLRGQIITVIALRERFGLNTKEKNENMRIMIVNFRDEKIGLLIDQVNEIINVDSEEIKGLSSNFDLEKIGFFKGVYKMKKKLAVVLNLENILKME